MELLDKYFSIMYKLDTIFNFEKAYLVLDEFLLAGDVQDPFKKNALKCRAD